MASHTKWFTFAHLNIRSVCRGFDLFSEMVTTEGYSVLGLSETWLNQAVGNNNITIPNYRIVRKDRATRGGGVAFYVHNTVKFSILEPPTHNDCPLEHLWISTKIAGKRICLGTIYRPPNSNFNHCLECLENVLISFMANFDIILLGGDFNVDLLNLNNINTTHLTNFLNKYDLHQLISQPTRITENSKTLIDLIICSDKNFINDVNVINMEEISDHSMVDCSVKLKRNKQHQLLHTYRDFSKFDYDIFLVDLFRVNWAMIFELESIDEKVEFWNKNILEVFDMHAPYKTVRISKSPAPWLTDNLKLMMKLRDKAYSKYKKIKTDSSWRHYKELRNFVNMSVKLEKKAYLVDKSKTNPKEFWKCLKYLNINSNTKEFNSDFGTANSLNDFFINSVPNTSPENADIILNKYSDPRPTDIMFKFSQVSVEKVEKTFRTIKSNAKGFDGIDLKMLSLVLPHLSEYLTHIINMCLTENCFPSAWKTSNIIPIPKVSSPSDLSHFRPISILPTVSKILEKIVAEQLNLYLSKYKILPPIQSGFRADHSTTTALLHVTDDIYRAIDSNKNTCLVLLDFSKAFDTLNHITLCTKLKYFNFSNSSILFFQNYLHNRRQRVLFNGCSSEHQYNLKGVPQGSVLGPLLFSIYTADFYECLTSSTIHQYADDTQIYFSFYPHEVNTAIEVINSDLEQLAVVSKAHGLVLNESKTEVLLFGRNKIDLKTDPNFKIVLNNQVLKFSDSCKNLGVYIDEDLRYSTHVRHLLQKSYAKLKLLYMNKDILSNELKLTLCNTLILSALSYCDAVYWPALLKRDQLSLQKVQNSCLRLSFNLRKFDHISRALHNSKWLTLNERYQLHMACLVYKIVKIQNPVYLFLKLVRGSDIHSCPTRSRHLFTVPKHTSAQFEKSFSYNSVNIFNSLPSHIQSLPSITSFREQVKGLIFANRQ